MKYAILIALILLVVVPGFAQTIKGGNQSYEFNRGTLVKSYTNFTAASDDTTGYVGGGTVLGADVLGASEVYLITATTDSAAVDVTFQGKNSFVTSFTASYADSVVTTSNTGATSVITLKSPTLNRLAGCTEFKIANIFRATGQGTTAGRTYKQYLMVKR